MGQTLPWYRSTTSGSSIRIWSKAKKCMFESNVKVQFRSCILKKTEGCRLMIRMGVPTGVTVAVLSLLDTVAYAAPPRADTSASPPGLPPHGWPLPLNWSQVPDTLAHFPHNNATGALLVQPWVYEHRLALYRAVVSATNKDPIASAWWGGTWQGDVIWGLPLQFDWQQTSGRLLQQPAPPTPTAPVLPGHVSATSWWACMNW